MGTIYYAFKWYNNKLFTSIKLFLFSSRSIYIEIFWLLGSWSLVLWEIWFYRHNQAHKGNVMLKCGDFIRFYLIYETFITIWYINVMPHCDIFKGAVGKIHERLNNISAPSLSFSPIDKLYFTEWWTRCSCWKLCRFDLNMKQIANVYLLYLSTGKNK